MNYMKQIATDILGLYWDDEKNESEKFRIKEFACIYKLTPKGICMTNNGLLLNEVRFVEILKGELEIERIPWKLKDGEKYYFITGNGDIDYCFNGKTADDAMRIKSGWVFRTEEEAKANKKRVLEEMREVLCE